MKLCDVVCFSGSDAMGRSYIQTGTDRRAEHICENYIHFYGLLCSCHNLQIQKWEQGIWTTQKKWLIYWQKTGRIA